MSYRIAILFIGYMVSGKALAQSYDSVHVYALYMYGSYYIKIDKNLIKNEADLIPVKEGNAIIGIDHVLQDTIKGKYLQKLKSNNIDSRLIFEFFDNGVVRKVVGITSYGTMFIDHHLYEYDKATLRYLDRHIPGLTGILGVK